MQVLGGLAGMMAAHLMFDLPIWQIPKKQDMALATGQVSWIATFGLVATISIIRYRVEAVPAAVAIHHGGVLVYVFHFIR